MKQSLIWMIVSFLFIQFLFLHEVLGETMNVEAVILFMEGDVNIKEAGSVEWVEAELEKVLSIGDSLKTGSDSWAEIGLGKNYENVVRIQENSIVEITDLGPAEVNLLQGELRALVEDLSKDETFEITTPVSICGVRGTGWDTNTDGKSAVVDVYEESVYFSGVIKQGGAAKGEVVGAGKRAILEDPTKPLLIKDLPIERIQDWKSWKQDFMKRRKGIKKGLKEKIGRMKQGQKTVEDIIKGKQTMLEEIDEEGLLDRTAMDNQVEP